MPKSFAFIALLTLAACDQAALTPTEVIASETTAAIEQNPGSASTTTTGTPSATVLE